jgi:hypothetical protein
VPIAVAVALAGFAAGGATGALASELVDPGWVSVGAGGLGAVVFMLILRRVLSSFDDARSWAQDALSTERRLHREDVAAFQHAVQELRSELHLERYEADKWRRQALGLEPPPPYQPGGEW